MEEVKKYKYKYNCEKCDYHTNTESAWNIHINREKHKTGKNKRRSDAHEGSYKCEKCGYETLNYTVHLQHQLNNHSTIEERRLGYRYYCESCDYGAFYEEIINHHNKSEKHRRKCNNN